MKTFILNISECVNKSTRVKKPEKKMKSNQNPLCAISKSLNVTLNNFDDNVYYGVTPTLKC
jgi:hypothetical protein